MKKVLLASWLGITLPFASVFAHGLEESETLDGHMTGMGMMGSHMGSMGGYSTVFGWITMVLVWATFILVIAYLWKLINKK